jgi:CHAT domain-containing protein
MHTRSANAGAAVLRRLDRWIPVGDSTLAAAYICTRATIEPEAFHSPTDTLRVATTLAREAGSWWSERMCDFAIAFEFARRGEMAASVAVLDTMERRVIKPHDDWALAVARQHRAYAEYIEGDYGSAWRSAHIAIARGRASRALTAVAYAQLTEAGVALGVGDAVSAAAVADSAASALAAVGEQIGVVNAYAIRGRAAFAIGDTAAARRAYDAELTMAGQVGAIGNTGDAHEGLANVATVEEQWDTAAAQLAAVHALVLRGMPGWETDVHFARSTLALRRGHAEEAARDLRATLQTIDSSQHSERYATITRLAEAELAAGDTVRAAQELEDASNELDRWRATLDDRGLRILAFQYQDPFGGPDPGFATLIAAMARTGRINEAFAMAERRRARDLVDQLERASGLSTADAPVSAPFAGGPVGLLHSVQAALPDDSTLFLEYVTGPAGAPTTAFAITRTKSRAYMLPPADSLAADISRLTALIQTGDEPRALSTTLGEILLGQPLDDAGRAITHIAIVADGALLRTPFAALRLRDTFVVQRTAISLVPSGLVATRIWGRRPTATPGSVLALGDPRFTAKSASAAGNGSLTRDGSALLESLPQLPGSAREAKLVARFGTRSLVRLRDSASAAYFKHAPLQSFEVIHLATHAVVDDQAVTRTGLALSPGEGESGFLTPADLATQRLGGSLVVLSACRAAGGVIATGEGIRGLTSPLLAAGARAIVASQWEIGDRRTIALMHDLYRALASGHRVDEALQTAEIAALHSGAPMREWAAFSITGDPTTRVTLVVPHWDWLPEFASDWLGR